MFKSQWSLYVPPGLTLKNSTFCPHSVFMCFVWISEQTAIVYLYNINWLVFITETESVYSAVRTGYLNARNLHVNISLQMFTHVTGYLFVFVKFQQTGADHNRPSVSTQLCVHWKYSRCVCIPHSWRSPLPSVQHKRYINCWRHHFNMLLHKPNLCLIAFQAKFQNVFH